MEALAKENKVSVSGLEEQGVINQNGCLERVKRLAKSIVK